MKCKACNGTGVANESKECGHVEFREASMYGPEVSGWCIPTGDDYGATTYSNVNFCPWCGADLSKVERPR